jgi:hypothetical protein
MKSELTKQFVKKTIRRTMIFAIVMIIVAAISQSMSPVISNSLALTQMQNDNVMFVIMDTYNRIKPIFNALYSCVILWFVYTLGRDTYKFVKTINTNNSND